MPTKQAAKVAEAFLGVMTRFGACAEVLTDNGTEFQREFKQLCQKLFLDHRWTSRSYPQSNGLTERLVKTIKTGITKYETENDRRTWDKWLPYLVIGYRMSN
jgi:transposase InsO family protein